MKIVKFIDKFSEWTGKIMSWTLIPLTLVMTYEVIMRYIFSAPTMWAYDVGWMLYSIFFMLGGAYTLYYKRHVRIDLIYNMLSTKGQAIYEILFYIIMYIPVMLIFIWYGWDFALDAWKSGQSLSTSIWNFPAAPIRTVIPLTFFTMLLQGIAELIKNINFIFSDRSKEGDVK